MKCPKCGYTSFETSDNCRKCSNDLIGFRQTYGLTPIVLPAAVRTSMAQSLNENVAEEQPHHEQGNDMFSFDLPQHEEATAPPPHDPFDFTSQQASGGTAISFDTPAPASNDPFAELLETTPASPKGEAAAPQEANQGFELNSFSWDDTPEPPTAGTPATQEPAQKTDDDFSSLFGDLGKSEQKP